MKKTKLTTVIAICLICFCCGTVTAQNDTATAGIQKVIGNVSGKMVSSVEEKYNGLQKDLSNSSVKLLKRLKKKEEQLQKKLDPKDTAATKQLFAEGQKEYDKLLQGVKDPAAKLDKGISSLKEYLPGLDSMKTALGFLNKAGSVPGLPTDKLTKLNSLSAPMDQLQAQFQSATDIKQFVSAREKLLQDQLSGFGLGKQLTQLNKQVYYYQQQLNDYKNLVNDPEKLEKKLLTAVKDVPSFKNMMAKNSQLAQLFNVPGSGTTVSLDGLQSKDDVQNIMAQQMGGSGASADQVMQDQVQQAQGELTKLKDKLSKLGGGSSDLPMPAFTPNKQKTKTFWKRIEYGFTIQSQKTSSLLPVTSDLALTAGYKLSDKSTIGFGAGYKLGWGDNFRNIHFTSQGVSLRSFVDLKLKGSIWITGGYEENYLHDFVKLEQLKDVTAWQKSGLIGLSKKYKLAKKTGNLQLLYDMLSKQHIPQTAAFLFRLGYTF